MNESVHRGYVENGEIHFFFNPLWDHLFYFRFHIHIQTGAVPSDTLSHPVVIDRSISEEVIVIMGLYINDLKWVSDSVDPKRGQEETSH